MTVESALVGVDFDDERQLDAESLFLACILLQGYQPRTGTRADAAISVARKFKPILKGEKPL